MIIAGHTLGTPGRDLPEALALFRTAGLDAAEVIYQDDYPAAIRPSDRKSAQQAATSAAAEGVPIVGLTPYTTAINSIDARTWQQGIDEFRGCLDAAQKWEPDASGSTPVPGSPKAPTTLPTGTSFGQRSVFLLPKRRTPTWCSASKITSAR